MSYVGEGHGGWISEVTYRYVGAGGNFEVVKKKQTNYCIFVGIGLVAIALLMAAVVMLALSGSTESTSKQSSGFETTSRQSSGFETTSKGSSGFVPGGTVEECIVWGDPHIDTFDGGHADFYSEGEVWMVKSQNILIQARYKATPFTNGLAATDALAIGGPFIGKNVLKVGALNGEITWNDQPILTTMGSLFDMDGLGSISQNGHGDFVDDAMSNFQKHVVHIDLPEHMHIQVMRWSHHINLKLEMPQAQGGQDGHCGNFNGDAADDTTAAILLRMGQGVTEGESIFNTWEPFEETEEMSLDDCPPDQRESAQNTCEMDMPGVTGVDLDSCIMDVCFGGERYAVQDSAY